jgi:hypothetical protein
MECGKPIKDARGEVTRSIDTFQVAAEESTRIYGEHLPLDISPRNKGLQVYCIHMIVPWILLTSIELLYSWAFQREFWSLDQGLEFLPVSLDIL